MLQKRCLTGFSKHKAAVWVAKHAKTFTTRTSRTLAPCRLHHHFRAGYHYGAYFLIASDRSHELQVEIKRRLTAGNPAESEAIQHPPVEVDTRLWLPMAAQTSILTSDALEMRERRSLEHGHRVSVTEPQPRAIPRSFSKAASSGQH